MKRWKWVLAAMAVVMPMLSSAQAVSQSRLIEEEMLQVLKDHCDGLMSGRANAVRNENWREVFALAKRYTNACRGADDKFAISKAYEDMGWASMMLDDPRMGLMYVQQCVDANAFAGGCYARKTQIQLALGESRKAGATAWKGLARTERAIVLAKQQLGALKRPDLRAEQYWRTRYLRKREELENRITGLEEARRNLQDLNEEFE